MEENIGIVIMRILIDIISVKLYISNSFNYVIIMYKYKYLANIHITKWNIILYCALPLLTILVISYFLSRSKGLTFNQKIVRLIIAILLIPIVGFSIWILFIFLSLTVGGQHF